MGGLLKTPLDRKERRDFSLERVKGGMVKLPAMPKLGPDRPLHIVVDGTVIKKILTANRGKYHLLREDIFHCSKQWWHDPKMRKHFIECSMSDGNWELHFPDDEEKNVMGIDPQWDIYLFRMKR